MSPVEELRAAANKLRETAKNAAPGPWDVDGPWWWETKPIDATATISTAPARETIAVIPPAYNRHPQAEHSAAWIALMHSGLAEPFAAWLEAAANEYWDQPWHEDWPECQMAVHALAVARVILGGAE